LSLARSIARPIARSVARPITGESSGGGAPQLPSVSSLGIFFSPYNWFSDGSESLQSNNIKSDATYAISNTPGAYFKTRFSGTSFSIAVDVAAIVSAGISAGNYPVIEYQIDGGAWQRVQLASSSSIIELASSLSVGIHTIECHFVGVIWSGGDRWITPVLAIKITDIILDDGEFLYAPTIKPKRAMLYGDSHSEGYEVLASGTTVANQNARLAWPALLASHLNAEYGVAGFAGQGYTVGVGGASLPDCEDAWNFYSSGKSRLVSSVFAPDIDYVVSGHGTNDADGGALQTAVQNTLAAMKAASPNGVVFSIMPPGGNRTTIIAGTDAVADSAVIAVQTNTNYMTGANVNGSHLSEIGQVNYAAGVWAAMEPLIPAIAIPSNTVLPTITGVPNIGQTLSLTRGSWSGFPSPTFTQQWRRNGVDLSGQTGTTYVIQSGDLNASISVAVTATNSQGSATAESTGVEIVEPLGITLVSQTTRTGTTSGGNSTAINTTGADLLVVAASWFAGTTANITITDSAGNTWVELTKQTHANNQAVRIFYVENPVTSASHTITVSGAGTFAPAWFAAFSGSFAGSPLQNGATVSAATTLQTGAVAPSVAALVIAAAVGASSPSSLPSGYSLGFVQAFVAGTSVPLAVGYKIQDTAVSENPQFAWSGNSFAAAVIAAFEP